MSETSHNSVRVLRRAFEILEAFTEKTPVLSLQKISDNIDLPKTTTFRLLATMIETGYILQRGNQDYCLSLKFMGLASVAQSTFDIRDIVRPVMEWIRDKTEETVDLSLQSGTSRICLDVVESPLRIKSIIRPGESVSLELGAVGKILLAFSKEDILEKLIISCSIDPTFDADRLRRQVQDARLQGYSQTSNERVPGASAIAVPLRNHTGFALYALAVTGPAFRFDARSAEFRNILIEGGTKISEMLGWTGQRTRMTDEVPVAPAKKKKI